MTARDELRDCFLSDSRDRFEAVADAYLAEELQKAANWLMSKGHTIAASDLDSYIDGGESRG